MTDPTARPFLMITIRENDDAARAEMESVRVFGGLKPSELVQVRAEKDGLGGLSLDDYAGVIIGGSPFNASDDEKTPDQQRVEDELGDLIDRAIACDIPLLGICYGVGLVTSRLGGVVDRRYGEKAGTATVELTAHGLEDPVFAGVPPSFLAYTGHKEACSLLPDGAVLLATGRACPVQAFRVGRHVYVTQFHVELDAAALEQRMRIYAHHGYFRPEELEMLVAENHSAGVGPEPRAVLANFVKVMRG